jgi:hypothetical protein
VPSPFSLCPVTASPFRLRQRMLACCIWLAIAIPASAAPFAYFSDTGKNNFTVVDMANYSTVITTPLGTDRSAPIDTVVNNATGKIFIGTTSGVVIIDAATNAITGEVLISESGSAPSVTTTGVIALAVSPDGKRVFALSKGGSITVLDPIKKTILGSIAVDPSSNKMAVSLNGENLYVSSTGFGADRSTVLGVAGVTVIDTMENSTERVINIGNYFPLQLAIHPTDGRIIVTGDYLYPSTEYGYLILDPDNFSVRKVALAPENVQRPNLLSVTFNENGSRVYMSGTGAFTRAPLLEIDTETGQVLRVLTTGDLGSAVNTTQKLTSSFASGKFVLVAFLRGYFTKYPFRPATRVAFIDVQNNLILKELVYSQSPGIIDYQIAGDIFEPTIHPNLTTTSTTLQGSANPPLRRSVPLRFYATVTGDMPTGKVVFKFVAYKQNDKLIEKVRVPLKGSMATLFLPACGGRWDNRALRDIICTTSFSATAIYRGDTKNSSSRSAVLDETY